MDSCDCAGKGKPPFTKRAFAAFRWLVPGIMLAILPKCPLCLAAYVAMGTGIGLSFSAASWLQAALVAVFVVSLAFFPFSALYQLFLKRLSESVARKRFF